MPKKKPVEKNVLKENSDVDGVETDLPKEGESSQIDRSLEDFGQQIRETRIANNLSLESVSGHLHISVKILEAIEDGKPKKGPTPVFFRGLVRTYCQFLELDKTEFIEKLDYKLRALAEKEENINIKPLKPVFKVSDSFPFRNILTFLVILIGGTVVYYLYVDQTTFDYSVDNLTKTKSENVKILPEIKTNNNAPQIIQNQISKDQKTPEKQSGIENFSLIKNKEKKIISPIETKENYEPLTLEVEASIGTWISLAIDNSDTKDYHIGTDEIKQWVAKNYFLLTIGNTKVIRVLLNGREIETNRTNDLLTNWLVDSSYLP